MVKKKHNLCIYSKTVGCEFNVCKLMRIALGA